MFGFISRTLVAPSESHLLQLRETLRKAGVIAIDHPKKRLQLLVTCKPEHVEIVQAVALRLECTVKGRVSGAIRLSWPPLDGAPELLTLFSRLRERPPVVIGKPWSNADVCAYELSTGITMPRDLVELLYKFGELSLPSFSIDLGLQKDERARRLLPRGALFYGSDISGFAYAIDLAGALDLGATHVIVFPPDATSTDDAHVQATSIAGSMLSLLDGIDPRTLPTVATTRRLRDAVGPR